MPTYGDAHDLMTQGDYPDALRLLERHPATAMGKQVDTALCEWLQAGVSDRCTRRNVYKYLANDVKCSTTNSVGLLHYTHTMAYVYLCMGSYQYATHYVRLAIELASALRTHRASYGKTLLTLHRLRLAIACADNMYLQTVALDDALEEADDHLADVGGQRYEDYVRRLLMRVMAYLSMGDAALKAAHLTLRVIHSRPSEIRSLPGSLAVCLQLAQARYALMTGDKEMATQHAYAARSLVFVDPSPSNEHNILKHFVSPLAHTVAQLHYKICTAGMHLVTRHCDFRPLLACHILTEVGRGHVDLERQWTMHVLSDTPCSSQSNILTNLRWASTYNRALAALFAGQWTLALKMYAYMLKHRPANYILWLRFAQCCVLKWNEKNANHHCYRTEEEADAATFQQCTQCNNCSCVAPHPMAVRYTGVVPQDQGDPAHQARSMDMAAIQMAHRAIRTATTLIDKKCQRFEACAKACKTEQAESATLVTFRYLTAVNDVPVEVRHKQRAPSAQKYGNPAMSSTDAPFMRQTYDEMMKYRVYIYTTHAYTALSLSDPKTARHYAQTVVDWSEGARHHVSPTYREYALTYAANACMEMGKIEEAKGCMRMMRPVDTSPDDEYHTPPRITIPPPPPGFTPQLQSYLHSSMSSSGTAFRAPSIATCVAHNAGVLHAVDGNTAAALNAIRQAKLHTRPLHTHMSLSTQLMQHACALRVVDDGKTGDSCASTVLGATLDAVRASREKPYNMPVLLKSYEDMDTTIN